jgi:hypothetical protein
MSQRQHKSDEENQLRPTNGGNNSKAASTGSLKAAVNSHGAPDAYFDRLIRDNENELIYSSNGNTIFNLATLQQMVLTRLQINIIEKVGPLIERRFNDSHFGGKHPLDVLKNDLAIYGNIYVIAIQPYFGLKRAELISLTIQLKPSATGS